jgi:undecaprenyl-diphosphatase
MVLSIWEKEVFLFFHRFHHPLLNDLMVFFSSNLVWIFPLFYFVFAIRNEKKKYQYFFLVILLFLITDVTSGYFFKNIFQRLRPCRMEEILPLLNNFNQKCGGKYGFFSSHASNSVAFITFLFGLIKSKFNFVLGFFTFIVIYSRLYLGVHFPLDLIIGSLWGFICGKIFLWFAKELKGLNET